MPLFVARHIPNFITLLRILLTLPVSILLLRHQYNATLILFLLAGFSDGLDGFLAKSYGWQSRLGGLLDPLADKILFMSTFLILGITNLIPIWLVIVAVGRDLVIVTGTLLYQFKVGDVQPAPSRISKFNTLLQILLAVLVIMNAGPYPIPRLYIDGLQWLLLGTLIISGSHYVYLWSLKAATSRIRQR